MIYNVAFALWFSLHFSAFSMNIPELPIQVVAILENNNKDSTDLTQALNLQVVLADFCRLISWIFEIFVFIDSMYLLRRYFNSWSCKICIYLILSDQTNLFCVQINAPWHTLWFLGAELLYKGLYVFLSVFISVYLPISAVWGLNILVMLVWLSLCQGYLSVFISVCLSVFLSIPIFLLLRSYHKYSIFL